VSILGATEPRAGICIWEAATAATCGRFDLLDLLDATVDIMRSFSAAAARAEAAASEAFLFWPVMPPMNFCRKFLFAGC
jgi:hypothetical protein